MSHNRNEHFFNRPVTIKNNKGGYLRACGGGYGQEVIDFLGTAPQKLELFTITPVDGDDRAVLIQTVHNTYLSADYNGKLSQKPMPQDEDQHFILNIHGDRRTIQKKSNGLAFSFRSDGSTYMGSGVRDENMFHIEQLTQQQLYTAQSMPTPEAAASGTTHKHKDLLNKNLSIRGNNNKFMRCCEGQSEADLGGVSVGPNETFVFGPAKDDCVTIRCLATGKFLCSHYNGNVDIKVNGMPEEDYDYWILDQRGGKYVIHNKGQGSGLSVSAARDDGTLYVTSGVRDDEHWVIEEVRAAPAMGMPGDPQQQPVMNQQQPMNIGSPMGMGQQPGYGQPQMGQQQQPMMVGMQVPGQAQPMGGMVGQQPSMNQPAYGQQPMTGGMHPGQQQPMGMQQQPTGGMPQPGYGQQQQQSPTGAAPMGQPQYGQQQPMMGGMNVPGQAPMNQQPMGGMPGQQMGQPAYGQQPMMGGMPGQQQPGGMPQGQPGYGQPPMGQQPMMGGMPGQQPAGMPGQQPAGMPGQQPGYPPQGMPQGF